MVIAAVAASAEGVMAVVDLVVGEVVIVVVAASAEGAMAVAGVVVAGEVAQTGHPTGKLSWGQHPSQARGSPWMPQIPPGGESRMP